MARKRPSIKEQNAARPAVSRLAGIGTASETGAVASWGSADPILLAGIVVSVTRLGGLASFGYTRDGGAATLTIFLDDERTTVYVKPSQDMDRQLAEVIDHMDSLR